MTWDGHWPGYNVIPSTLRPIMRLQTEVVDFKTGGSCPHNVSLLYMGPSLQPHKSRSLRGRAISERLTYNGSPRLVPSPEES
jgi:hypothetical protein